MPNDDDGLFIIPEDDGPKHMSDDVDTDYLLPENVYQILKWIGLILMPALSYLFAEVGEAWGYDPLPVVKTVNAIGVFIGMVIGASCLTKDM